MITDFSSALRQSLERFTEGNDLREACILFLEGLHFHLAKGSPAKYVRGSDKDMHISKFLVHDFVDKNQELIEKILTLSYVGTATPATFNHNDLNLSLEEVQASVNEDHYKSIVFFCIDTDQQLKRSEIVALSRAFNRQMQHKPVVLFIRFGNLLSLTTCKRAVSVKKNYVGEIVGKVSILRDINCEANKTHPGHILILEDLALSKSEPSFDDIYENWLKTFDSELLTKRFYKELSIWHAWAIDEVRFPNDICSTNKNKDYNHENVIRLVTRLIFVWLLKEKHLIPEELFDEQFVRNKLIKGFNPHAKDNLFFKSTESKYYKAILQNLFFATLNCPILNDNGEANNRHFSLGSNDGKNPKVMKYESYFTNPQLFLDLVNNKVPFLNGGLFDCLDDGKRYFFDGFSEDEKIAKSLCVPDYLFFGEEVGKDIDLSPYFGDKKKSHSSARGIIDILSQYKFTVEENTPYEQEVSLDPELLGKVFENLLAEYNPETGSTVRKSSGSYYTPREVVQYMVDETLVDHLKRTVDSSLENTYRELLSYSSGEVELSNEVKKSIMKSLYNCKVLDPACGSGAFPVGMLQQMVHILSRIDPTNEGWKDLMIDVATEMSRAALKKESQEEREERLKDIYATFDEHLNYPDYARKLYIIENCIHGVDIQPIAIQISHLRFFISLIVDQKENSDPKMNFGIRPLPNLEAKFVAANSIIPLQKTRSLFSTSERIMALEERLREANHQIFKAKTPQKKAAWRRISIESREKLANAMVEEEYVFPGADKQIASWDMFEQNCSASFFDPEWMFGIVDGFDIVIGNPPYIKERTNRSAFDGFRDTNYYMGKMDLWYGFACFGIDYLTEGGVLCFIAQNNWTTSGGAKLMRNKVTSDSQIVQMIDFNEYMVFGESASIQTMIMLFKKNNSIDNYPIVLKRLNPGAVKDDFLDLLYRKPNGNFTSLTPILNRRHFLNKYLTFSPYDELLNKIQLNKGHLMSTELSQGVIFPQDFLNKKAVIKLGRYHVGDAVFAFSTQQLRDLNLPENEKAIIRPYFTSSQIGRYYVSKSNDYWMIYTDSKYKDPHSLDSYPILKKHLDKFQSIITSSFKPYGIHRARKEKFFIGEKIISLRKCEHPCFAYSDNDCFFTQTYNSIKTDRWDMLFLTGLFNSSLIEFWLKHKGKRQGENFQVDTSELVGIPIISPSDDAVKRISSLVKEINRILEQDKTADITDLERQIDVIIFHLYGLSYNEVLLIIPDFWLTPKEYDIQN